MCVSIYMYKMYNMSKTREKRDRDPDSITLFLPLEILFSNEIND